MWLMFSVLEAAAAGVYAPLEAEYGVRMMEFEAYGS
jgi:hypothetical protein